MAQRGGPQTWRLLRLARWTAHPCPHCGAEHEYLTRSARGQGCQPVLFPPGLRAGGASGVEVEVYTPSPAALPGTAGHDTPYQRAARRVAATAIRCERCGTLFEDLDAYVDHPCQAVPSPAVSDWPVAYFRDGDRLLVVASAGGEPRHPAWYLNLRDNPRVAVQLGRETRRMLAVTATGEERTRPWARIVAVAPNFADRERKASRAIPVVILADME